MKNKISKISKLHYIKLFIRTLFLIGSVFNLIYPDTIGMVFIPFVWLFFMLEMIFTRFIPSKNESMGCQKIFKKNFIPANNPTKRKYKPKIKAGIFYAILILLVLFILHQCNLIKNEVLIIFAMFLSVCDMLCVLFFCPFQKWFMGNRCCNTCTIYNWDYIMMFIPLICIPNFYNYSLLLVSFILFLVWEITYFKYPERFENLSNKNISCLHCKEKRCRNYKKHH